MILWSTFGALLIILDLSTKWLAQSYLQNPLEIIPQILRLSVSQNTGIAFSIPIPNIIMIFLTPFLIVALAYLIVQTCNISHRATKLCLTLILAGALGNFINRLYNGAVTDFIDFSFWPSFNLADSYLTAGIFLLLIFYGKINRKTYGTR